jgi:hypothetical protein
MTPKSTLNSPTFFPSSHLWSMPSAHVTSGCVYHKYALDDRRRKTVSCKIVIRMIGFSVSHRSAIANRCIIMRGRVHHLEPHTHGVGVEQEHRMSVALGILHALVVWMYAIVVLLALILKVLSSFSVLYLHQKIA